MKLNFAEMTPSFDGLENQPLYLFVDGGQISKLPEQLYEIPDGLDIEPIYIYEPYDKLRDVSPYIVTATASVRNWFFQLNDVTAGFFFSSDSSLDDIREYYRRFIKAQSPYGSDVFLKMAHSEVAWILLGHKDSPFWGPIKSAWIPTRMGWQHLTAPEEPHGLEEGKVLLLNDQLWEELGTIPWRNTQENIAHHIDKFFPEERFNHSDYYQWINDKALEGYNKGFSTERDLIQYFNVLACVGSDEQHIKKAYPQIDMLMNKPSELTPSQRIEKAAQMAWGEYTTNNKG
ncbi:DUF4123 domain-containing protein [Vibrio sp. CAIM 722]|uniref:DUF4123 domain-containing protein n=1 Tax=Vibrio eleionomae TaxID=2653505 RepID=A0A7X4RWE1_9VIBR|nr:DUF4123 domain-containing protein [Vibrio eleionomae]MZI95290.1 DUF4123 domain-containing protein [Vibrio eleionomae]